MADIVNPIGYQIDTLFINNDEVSNNAPVTRVLWECGNLPAGLTLSSSGELSGHPTVSGIFDCNISVTTNWGTVTKVIRITIE